MSLPLPPLTAMRVFEAAARLSSFTKAAAELGMTQAAVSYQIKLLEERVGAPLFLRKPRQVVLTETGLRLAPKVGEAFGLLRDAYASARAGSDSALCISTMLTFASNWLARHIGSFQLHHPGIAVRLDTSSDLVDFARQDVDVAIRSGEGQWPGLVSHLLFRNEYTPMLHPRLAESVGGIREPVDLLKLRILDPTDPWWRRWFTLTNVSADSLEGRPDTNMGSQSYEANAALAGQGVAILTRKFFTADLAEGRLVQPFDMMGYDGQGYWLVYPESRRNVPKIRAFRDWIMAELGCADA